MNGLCLASSHSLALSFPPLTGGESGSADTARDPRGFAVKMYTEEGNWDCVGNNTPIFFIRDPLHVSGFGSRSYRFCALFKR